LSDFHRIKNAGLNKEGKKGGRIAVSPIRLEGVLA